MPALNERAREGEAALRGTAGAALTRIPNREDGLSAGLPALSVQTMKSWRPQPTL